MDILEVERSLVGMCLAHESNLLEAITSGVNGSYFQDEFLGKLFETMRGVWGKGEKVNVFTVSKEVGTEKLDELKIIRSSAPVAQNFGPYVQAVIDWQKQESLKSKLVDLSKLITYRKPMEGFHKVSDYVFSLLSACHGRIDRLKFVTALQASEESLERGRKRVEDFQSGKSNGIPTGFPTLDKYLYGLNPGMVYVVGARTSVGKTTLATNIAYTAAAKGFKVGFLTVEMSASDIADKLLCMSAKVPMSNFLSGKITANEGAKIEDASLKVGQLPIVFTEIKSADLATLELSLMRLVKVDNVQLVILDYLQLFDVDDGKFRKSFEATKEISKSLKMMARNLEVPILVLSQLNRAAPEEGEPELIHIADSDQIARDSDAVMLLFRDGDGHFVSLAKNRRGKRGAIRLDAELEFNLFKEGGEI